MRVTKVKDVPPDPQKSRFHSSPFSSLCPTFIAFQLVYPISTMDVECTIEHNTKLITRKDRSVDTGILTCSHSLSLVGVVSDLFSFDETQQKRILDHYYFHDASFESPLLVTSSIYNIRQ